jgi:hypothetical protein
MFLEKNEVKPISRESSVRDHVHFGSFAEGKSGLSLLLS